MELQIITDIRLIIDEANYKDPGKLSKVLQQYDAIKENSCYHVRGTFKDLESLISRLPETRHRSGPVPRRQIHQQDQQTSPQVQPVEVSRLVMAYIEQKCADQLKKIQGKSFAIETQPDRRTSSTVQVNFISKNVTSPAVRAQFVRQRFITFYQRTASDLQVKTVPSSPQMDPKELQKTFPHLVFKPGRNDLTVTGPFMHIAKLEEFLSPRVRKSPVSKGPADRPRSNTPGGPSSPHSKAPEEDLCPICMDTIVTTERETLSCKHSFCRSCLKTAFQYKPVCPTCGELYGVLTGTQPKGGQMKVTTRSSSLPGYEKYGTIEIHYYIPSGLQQKEHPNPGQPYEGVSRTAFLPNSSEGLRILKLLRRAFDQRLVFTVGRSSTSGRNNAVTWNDIHHKTTTHGGPTNYGYPDPDYLSRVRDELKVKGIE